MCPHFAYELCLEANASGTPISLDIQAAAEAGGYILPN